MSISEELKKLLLSDAKFAYMYAKDVQKGRLDFAEDLILSSEWKVPYLMNTRLIGIAGFKGSGKSEVASMLCSLYGCKKVSFSSKLKDVVSVLFDLDRTLLSGDTEESRRWREQSLPSLSWLGDVTPRMLLQKIGTDLFREHLHPDFWLNIGPKQGVVDDVRFINELNKCDVRILVRRNGLTSNDRHISELEHLKYEDWDLIIDNDGTLEELEQKVRAITL